MPGAAIWTARTGMPSKRRFATSSSGWDTLDALRRRLRPDTCRVDQNLSRSIGSPAFLMGLHPVTNHELVALLNAGCVDNDTGGTYEVFNEFNPFLPVSFSPQEQRYLVVRPELADHPAAGVSWSGAMRLAALVGARLPKESEWELCATAGDPERTFPWGRSPPSPALANFGEHVGTTTPVG